MPMEQLLALYGYGAPTLTVESETEEEGRREDSAPTGGRRSGSSIRSRRRNRVVPLEAQKEVTPDDVTEASPHKEEHPRGVTITVGTGSPFSPRPEDLPSGGGVVATVLKTTPPPSSSTSTLSGGVIAALLDKSKVSKLSRADRSLTPSTKSPRSSVDRTESSPEVKGASYLRAEDTEEEVDVEEVGEVDFGMVRGNSEQMLRLDNLMDVVRMGDIEAGLNRNEEMLGEVGVAEGEGLETDSVEGVLSGREDYGELDDEEEGRGGVAGDLQRRLRRRKRSAVYEDVLLSSGNTQLLSDAIDDPTTEPRALSSDTSAYVRGSRLRPEFPERRSSRLMNSDEQQRELLNSYFVLSDGSGSESDEEYSPQEFWKKETKVGANYQALIPDYAPSTPYPSSATGSQDQLMWNPRGISDQGVSVYLETLSTIVEGVSSDPKKDHETALQVLLQCGYDMKTAWKTMEDAGCSHYEGMKPWTEEECTSFEEGLRAVRKDFFHLQRKVPTRSVKEIVEFYYLWKKTERYDHFIQQHGKIGRKKILVAPGHVSDFMDKYLDMHHTEAMDIHYLTTTVAVQAEMKKKENA